MSIETGSRIAQYRVERKLGVGGMGEVYLARDEKLNRLVALKLLTATDDVGRRRLAREARAAASLDHPGICAVYEVGSDATAGDFIAMQYIEGETLGARLRRGRMPPDEAMSIAAQIAEALVAAHKHGLVHRDLKPQNVILTPSGSARLLDFGLAQHVPTAQEAANTVTSSRVTDPHTVLGTPGYMSPEQVRNEPADYRTDVFALGCVVYECLTGHRAFTGATTAEVLGNILHLDPPPVSSIVPNIGPAYDALCARLLDKIPAERFHSAEEALGAIRALTPTARFTTKSLQVAPPRRRLVLRLAIAAGVIVAGLLSWQWYKRSALPIPTPEAQGWYLKGADAMRDGAFLSARKAFDRAIELFPNYAQAYSRLAEANTAMDDEQGARTATVKLGQLGPNRLLWPKEEQLRYDAASAASLWSYADAITAYKRLVDLKSGDAGRWLDLGRAQEVSPITPRAVALASYQKAMEIDPESAAARLRFGVLQMRAGKPAEGLAKIDEAIRLYHTGQSQEGEAEALLRRSTLVFETWRFDLARREDARQGYQSVLQMTSLDRYPIQWLGAQFGLAKLAGISGQLEDADRLARDAVEAADKVDLRVVSANGLLDLGQTLVVGGKFPEAEALIGKAIDLAKDRSATRVVMRAKLQRAAISLQIDNPTEALERVAEPYEFFRKTEDAKLIADAKTILSRAHENLEHYTEARPLAEDVIQFATTAKDDAVLGNALETLATQLWKLGSFPQVLPYREQLDTLQRNIPTFYARDLLNHAEVLIALGRAAEAEPLLQAFEKEVANGTAAFTQVPRRVKLGQLRALQAAIERRWDDVRRSAAAVEQIAAKPAPGSKPSDAVLVSRALDEYAAAQQGRSRTAPAVIAGWPEQASGQIVKRELAYWTGLTLLIRNQPGLAETVVGTALSAPGIRDNPEQGWRLAAVAAMIARQQPSSALASQLAGRKNTTPAELEAAWEPAASAAYFSRPDLVALRKGTR